MSTPATGAEPWGVERDEAMGVECKGKGGGSAAAMRRSVDCANSGESALYGD